MERDSYRTRRSARRRTAGMVAMLVLVAGGLGACGGKKPTSHAAPPPASKDGADVVARAKAFHVAKKLPPGSRYDCSGFVLAAYRAAGEPLEVPAEYQKGTRLSAMLLRWAEGTRRSFRSGSPAPGDLVFFRDTTGPLRGRVSHVGLVERVDGDGTVILLHHMGGKIRRDKMHLGRPDDPASNAWLRRKKRKAEPALAGELFVAYARFR